MKTSSSVAPLFAIFSAESSGYKQMSELGLLGKSGSECVELCGSLYVGGRHDGPMATLTRQAAGALGS